VVRFGVKGDTLERARRFFFAWRQSRATDVEILAGAFQAGCCRRCEKAGGKIR